MATKTRNRQQQRGNKQPQQSSQATQQQLQKRVDATLKRLEAKDPGLKKLLEKAHGYAVFPSVGKAALVVGGSYGRGAVFEKGKMIGYATISQMTIGVQIGGDTFTEILVFHDKGSLKRFKQGRMAFAANASAVLVKAAAAGTSDFKGVNALAYSSGGMLLELSLGGQKFTFKPLGEEDDDNQQQRQGKGAQSKRGGSEDEDDAEGDEADSGMLGRALSGVKDAASGVTDFAKSRPIAASLVGAGLVAGLAVLAMRALRSGKDEDDDYSEDDEESDARGSREDEDEGEEQDDDEDEGAEDSSSEDDGGADEEEDDDESSNNHVGMKRSRRFR